MKLFHERILKWKNFSKYQIDGFNRKFKGDDSYLLYDKFYEWYEKSHCPAKYINLFKLNEWFKVNPSFKSGFILSPYTIKLKYGLSAEVTIEGSIFILEEYNRLLKVQDVAIDDHKYRMKNLIRPETKAALHMLPKKEIEDLSKFILIVDDLLES